MTSSYKIVERRFAVKVVGIIAEYNPFHLGHLYQIQKTKEMYPNSIIIAIISTHFTETVCDDYMAYVEQTIEETEAGANEINNSNSVIQNVGNMLAYFKNVVKKCVNSVAIMVVITFVVPLLMMMLFRWLLRELFSLQIPIPNKQLEDFQMKLKGLVQKTELISKED